MTRPASRVIFLLLALVTFGLPATIEAQPARIAFTVKDPSGELLGDVRVTVTAMERGDVRIETTTNPRGRAVVMVPDVTKLYDFAFERDGYQRAESQVKPTLGETTFREVTLAPAGAAPVPAASAAGSQPVLTAAQQTFNAGIEALAEDDFDGALAKFLEAREMDPKLVAVHSALATVYLELKRPAEALSSAQRFLEAEPGNPQGLRLVYEAQRQLGNSAEAAKALAELTSKKGPEVAVLLYNEGAQAVNRGDLDAAELRFHEALAAQPDLHQASDALLVVYSRKGDWAKVAAQAEQVLTQEPTNLNALQLRYDAYRRLGDQEKEKQAFDALAAVDSGTLSAGYFDSGIAKFNANDVPGAIADFEKVAELDPAHASAHYYLGLCYTNAAKPDQAKVHLLRFLELAPGDANAGAAREMLKYLE